MKRWAARLRLLPGTIFWRLAGLTALAMLLSVAFTVTLFGYHRQRLVADQIAEHAGQALADIESALDGMGPEAQQSWLALNRQPYAPHLVPLDSPFAPPAGSQPRGNMGRLIAAALHRHADVGEVRERRGDKLQLWARVDMLGQPYWLVIPMGRLRSDPTWPLAAIALVFAALALGGAALFARRINRPLRELRLAAARLGRGERPTPLPETGPLEVRELSASFNRMLADLDANERERSVMLAGISHDLRTPLARLRLGVEMMRDDSLRDGMIEDVEDIERILSQFIAFARGDAGEEARPCRVEDIAHALEQRYQRDGCTLQLQLAAGLPTLLARPLALTRALSNLIDNARRYGRPPIVLTAEQRGTQLAIEIRDHGLGIADQHLAEALSPFTRLDSARRADGGAGLGLAIVERIARSHGGNLQLSRPATGGLAATLWLPLESTAMPASPELPSPH
ncbi:ATP-binding protein [Chitinimonas lacunae]|uniref:histidine kinase n=1 Tax=Chitinimonas lacunae TaxID=1963018 RepID=A0ABV8MV34_9NEIS